MLPAARLSADRVKSGRNWPLFIAVRLHTRGEVKGGIEATPSRGSGGQNVEMSVRRLYRHDTAS